MKIVLYIVLIVIVAAVACALYARISNVDATTITENISSGFIKLTDWIGDKIDEISSLISE